MSTLGVSRAIEKASGYSHAVLSWVAEDGYPVSVAGDFVASPGTSSIEVGPLGRGVLPKSGQQVGVTFSHIRPQPGIGYDERRYVNLWGPASVSDGRVLVAIGRASGWDEQELHFVEYSERAVPTAHGYMGDLGARPTLSRWWTFFMATRLPFLSATVVPVALGGAVAAADKAFAWGWFLLALLGAVAVHLGLNMANDIFDDMSGADSANTTPTMFSGGSRVLQHRIVTRKAMIGGCSAFYVAAITIGLVLAATRTWWLALVGVLGVALSLAYTAPPLKLVHRGLGEPVTAVGFGPLMTVGTYLAVTTTWSWHAFYASLPVALLIALVLYVNQVPDQVGDGAAGKRTLIVRFHKETVLNIYLATVAVAFALILLGAATGYMPRATLLALLPAPLALRVWRGLQESYDRPFDLTGAMQSNIQLHLFTGLLLVAGYVIFAVA